MKHIAFKSAIIFCSATLLLIMGTVSAHAQYYQLKVRTDDGLVTSYNVNRVDSIYFEFVVSDDNGNDEDETTVSGNATDITTCTATITSWANILDNLSSDLKVGIIYTSDGTPNKSNGSQITVSTSNIGDDAKYTITLTDLIPATTYYYRSFVYQSGVWFYGNVKSFTTKTTKGEGVELVSGEVTKLTCYSAKLSGAVSIDESTQYQSLSYGICYGTNNEPTVNNTRLQASGKDQNGNFTCQLRALTGSTTYYYRSYAYIDNYLLYGPIRSFTTKDDDVVITGDIDLEAYTVNSTLKIGSGAYSSLVLGVCYGTIETPTINDKTVTTNEVDDENNFILTLKDIPFGTTVYYRSFVKIDGVAHYGEFKNFYLPMPIGEAVDLGLSVKWATFNVGASKPEEYGYYYAWGETGPKTDYSWSTYKYCNGSSSTLTKYCNNSRYGNNGFTDTKTTLDPDDDVAHVKWGGDWRMPTKDEFTELLNNCTWTWTTLNGVNGYRVTSNKSGYTDRSIFLPAAGCRYGTYLNDVGSYGCYWSSSLRTGGPHCAWYVCFSSDYRSTYYDWRYYGPSVRPVFSSFFVLKLDAESVSLNSGDEITLTAVVEKDGQPVDFSVQWSSNNIGVATVSANGVVKGLSRGTALITAEYYGHKATCQVTVTESVATEYKYVDLGLSVKWATFNVGASKPEGYGDYFAWGETEPYYEAGYYAQENPQAHWKDGKSDGYTWSNYKYCNGSYDSLTKYNNYSGYGNNGFTDTKTTLDPDDDVAHVKWGGDWRMPTKDEFTELLNNCIWTWTTLNDVNGYRVTSNKSGYTDRSIFLPAAGDRNDTYLNVVGSYGNYWSSSLHTVDPSSAWYVGFSSDGHYTSRESRIVGQSVRPVCP